MKFRDYEEDPAPAEVDPADDRLDEQDFGNIVALEHINLEVPDLEVARLFYGEVLGLTQDPSRAGAQRGGAHVLWFNIGRQQFHIAKGSAPQLLPPGSTIGLVLPHVEAIKAQAQALRPQLGDLRVVPGAGGSVQVTDPHGVVFMVHPHQRGFYAQQGIAYIQLPCYKGTSALIAGFYNQTLGAPVKLHGAPAPLESPNHTSCIIRQESDAPEIAQPDNAVVPKPPPGQLGAASHLPPGSPRPNTFSLRDRVRAHVLLGMPGTKLVFYEEPALGGWSTQGVMSLYEGWHVCFYIAQFSHCYSRLRSLLFNTHPYKDKVHTFHDALRHHQFRFQDIVLLPPEGQLQLDGGPHGALVPVTRAGTQLAARTTHNTSAAAADAPAAAPAAAAASADGAAAPADGGAGQQQQSQPAPSGSETTFALVPKPQLGLEAISSLVACDVDHVTEEGVPCVPGQLLYRISHEVRSLAHPNFLRALFNRGAGFM